jgi:glycosyltransferase involved in cell wall biosynthesis
VRSNITCLGAPSDADLLGVLRDVEVGISVSLWEGFNLPLAELQYLGRPVFAFNLAAHPEVVVAPGQLCHAPEDMAGKVCDALPEQGPAWAAPATLGPWREQFSWQRFAGDFQRLLKGVA